MQRPERRKYPRDADDDDDAAADDDAATTTTTTTTTKQATIKTYTGRPRGACTTSFILAHDYVMYAKKMLLRVLYEYAKKMLADVCKYVLV